VAVHPALQSESPEGSRSKKLDKSFPRLKYYVVQAGFSRRRSYGACEMEGAFSRLRAAVRTCGSNVTARKIMRNMAVSITGA